MVKITRTAFLSEVAETATEAREKRWKYGNSQTLPPCLDGIISCDRLASRAIYKLGATNQPRGGCNSAQLANYLPKVGFTKTTDRRQLKAGDVVMVGKGPNQTYHTFVLAAYDPTTDRCDKYDMGSDSRILSIQPFRGVPLVEWGDRFFSMAFQPADDPAPEKSKKDIIKAGQEHSVKFTGHAIKIDGDRGKETRAQAFRVLRHALNLDYFGGEMDEDKGDTKLLEVALGTHYVKRGEKQHMVTAAEILLELQGIDPHGVEFPGQFGPGLEAAAGKSRIEAADFLKWCRA